MRNYYTKGVIISATVLLCCSCAKDPSGIAPRNPFPSGNIYQCGAGRPEITTQLVPIGNLSEARTRLAVATAGNKILFAGGQLASGNFTSRVDIYDIATNTWSTAQLSEAKVDIATVVHGKKIYFAGGATKFGYTPQMDIYDTDLNTWTSWSLPGVNQTLGAAAAGNKVVFASGITAHIYDAVNNSWTTAPLSEREGEGNCCQYNVGYIMATAIDDVIFFAGGGGMDVHNDIDIYNTTTGTWTASKLSEYKSRGAGIAAGKVNYWAGGETVSGNSYVISGKVEIRDMSTGGYSYDCLCQPNYGFAAVQRNDDVIFFTGLDKNSIKMKFDIYNTATKEWSIGILPTTVESAAIVTANNVVYVAGGKVNNVVSDKVYRLNF